ncbi:radical SAM protein [Petrotoga mexicana DSM 14811]|uniref:Radical SAM protein n=1 Tax=Petrotoga mexicana DSM 14811 TaxID=1122954 RepID=A0A2K1PAY5_9BACT|nr:radical SAM protein [Petrotoga mexicana DSM 14811]
MIKDIEFVILKNTSSVSLTGNYCYLNCKHCGGHYLNNMARVKDIENLVKKGFTSFLISGGLLADRKVPLTIFADTLYTLKTKYNLKYNVHTGYVDEKDIHVLKDIADTVSFDLVGDQQTVREVYGKFDYDKMWASFELLVNNDFVVKPHITIGLNKGEFSHEQKAIEKLKKFGDRIDEIIFLVFIPTVGTEFYSYQPPKVTDVVSFLSKARKDFPYKKLTLGCMHPKGKYREELQTRLLGIVNKIVQPIGKVIEKAERENYQISYSYECCAFSSNCGVGSGAEGRYIKF